MAKEIIVDKATRVGSNDIDVPIVFLYPVAANEAVKDSVKETTGKMPGLSESELALVNSGAVLPYRIIATVPRGLSQSKFDAYAKGLYLDNEAQARAWGIVDSAIDDEKVKYKKRLDKPEKAPKKVSE